MFLKGYSYGLVMPDKKKTSLMGRMKENPWIISTIVLAVILLFVLFGGVMTGNVISEGDAGEKIVEFANSQTGGGVELVEVNEKFGLYEVVVSYQGQDLPLYVTRDGETLIQGVLPLNPEEPETPEAPQTPDVPKSDKPTAELFIMTHCPYGTQAEKGFIPMVKALGDSIDAKIRFVHYFMHAPEETETPIHVCIREEQPDLWLDYLECFLEDGDSSRCLTEVRIDEEAMNACIDSGKADTYYEFDSGLSEGYGVRGSPTLVVNGQAVSSGRSPDAFLQTVCSAFNTAPDACSSLELSSESPSPGFGYSAAGSDTQAQC
jgi:protein-disulfide isomerase